MSVFDETVTGKPLLERPLCSVERSLNLAAAMVGVGHNRHLWFDQNFQSSAFLNPDLTVKDNPLLALQCEMTGGSNSHRRWWQDPS